MKYPIYIYCLLGSLIFFIGCQSTEQLQQSTETEVASSNLIIKKSQFNSSQFELGKITARPFSRSIKVSGEVVIPQGSQANVTSLIAGTVGSFNWREGQWVKRGALLFHITNPELINWQEEYLILQDQIKYLNDEVERQSKLVSENLSTQKDLYKIKSELSTDRTRYGALRKKLEIYGIDSEQITNANLTSDINIVAPISGYISDIKILRGSYIDPTQVALKISNPNLSYLNLSILEKDVQAIQKGQSLTFSMQGNPKKEYSATISQIGKEANPDHTINVYAIIEKLTKDVIPGMYTNAQIEIEEQTIPSLPKDAVIQLGQSHYVLKLIRVNEEEYEFEQIEVNPNGEQNNQVGLPELAITEDQYLTIGAYYMVQ